MRAIRVLSILVILMAVDVPLVKAQGVAAYFGVGSATDKASPLPLTLGGSSFSRSNMGGVFGLFGADFMLTPHWGFGGEYAFRFAQADYAVGAGLKARPSFYDLNLLYQPLETKRVVPMFQAGLGGARVSYYVNQQLCSVLSGCSSSSTLVDQSQHFQFHLAGGVSWFIRENVFIRPQLDVRWVHNFNNATAPAYGRNWVPQYSISIGYQLGQR
jgi:hypothetical protein